jgi:hypothetical protein
MAKPDASAPPGAGGRFAAMQKKLASKPGIRNPAAVAAAIGRKKYGAKKMASWAAKGRK